MKFLLILLCLLWSLLTYASGEYFSKRYANTPRYYLIGCVTLSYALAQVGWLPALRLHNQLSALTVVWSLSALVCGVLIGVIAFGEHLSSCQQVGMFLGFIAMILMFA
jgi:drug/metabolite transporter (DMT)-like permease